ncbi:MAG: adenosylcobalamin-dependent ribonucleoside-diphosphate reductase [Candidatus Aenigmarchaeota archaeon]|nr:adenosylcobalamin-dependent ribonucleoside-diphosphate reductase [Candidatus Aenigmarchaeota archaeon]
MAIGQMVKRDGSVVNFDKEKITNAIFKAAHSVGGNDKKIAEQLGEQVVRLLEESGKLIPSVEEIQDTVEKVLIESGHAATAKAYILYRQKRAEIREEKRKVLEKNNVDEVDKMFDINALRVLKSRYLRKGEDGKLMETPKQLFTRVATHTGLANILYDPRVFDMSVKQATHNTENFDPIASEGRYRIGKYSLNRYHLEALKRVYDRANREGNMKLSWNNLLNMIENGELNNHEADIENFYNSMVTKKFMPNTPAIANFGNVLGMGSACFVLGIDDSIESIMESLKQAAVIFKSGGGLGYNFSHLRPEGDIVKSTSGIASGPLSFMRLFDTMTEVIKQGGIRRGANMGILNSNHPDIEKFIKAKEGNKALRNFNISVLIMPDFWDYYEKNEPYPLINPRSGEIMRTVNPKLLFDMIVYQAWESAEPGVIFFDHVNKYNPFYEHLGPIVTTNPCGEVLLYPNEPCNLGSINVWAFVKEKDGVLSYDWESLKNTIRTTTRFLDNVIDVNKWPTPEIEQMALATRKVGLGIMGLADLLYELRLAYNSEEGRKFMEKLMEFVNYYSKVESLELAKARGPMPYLDKSFYPNGRLPFSGFEDKNNLNFDWDALVEEIKIHGVRNGYTTIIAPTGSISMIAGCSSGIEPVYTLAFEKSVAIGNFYYVDPAFEKIMREERLFDDQLIKDVAASSGTIQGVQYVPSLLKHTLVTAMDIRPEDHIRALAAFQRWTDSSISKTNNFPADATVEDMRESYLLAYKLGCKDVTVFRDSSIKNQVLTAVKREEPKRIAVETHGRNMENNDIPAHELKNCKECGTGLLKKEGCLSCPSCGWGICTSA